MNPAQMTHPTADELLAFGLGKLAEAETPALESHLAGCSQCRKALDELPADKFLAKLRQAMEEGSTTKPLSEAVTLARTEKADRAVEDGDKVPFLGELPPELANHPRYRVLQELGAGGMGVVYKAEHQLMERPVALKVINRRLTDEAAAVERFRREVRSAARLCHPNIVTAYDAEQAGDVQLFVMEFVEGVSLDRLIARQGPLPVMQACDYVRQAAQGLQHAFERGMVHRDIKPQNLMLTPAPGTRPWGLVKILDFGLARFAQEKGPIAGGAAGGAGTGEIADRPALTLTGTVMGTPDYVAPEQIRDPHGADIRADIYSLGCTLYFLLTGKVCFPEATAVEKLMAHEEKTPRPLTEIRSDVPPGLARVFERMTAKDPVLRYQTPAEVAQALEPFTTAASAAVVFPEPSDSPTVPEGVRRNYSRRALVASVFFGGPLLIFLSLELSKQQEQMGEHMETLYTVCAVVGGTLLVLQFLMSLFGLGHHFGDGADGHDLSGHDTHVGGEAHDAAHDTQMSWFVGLLTFRTLVAAVTFFGLAGRAAAAAEVAPENSFAIALAAGASALFAVAFLMRSLYRLRAEGTVRIGRALGQPATVYLSIPGHEAGVGKIQMNLQNRTVEYQAVTSQEALPSGTKVTVVGLVGPDTVEVVLASSPERISHV
jgi:serine/threonine protein kinase